MTDCDNESTIDPTTETGATSSLTSITGERDEEIVAIIAAARADGSRDRGREIIVAARSAPDATVRGLIIDDRLAAVYIMQKVGAANEIRALAAAPDHRGRGYEQLLLVDSFAQTGKRPLIVEASEGGRAFYQQAGFKLVGRRRQPDGQFRYRLGRHAPRVSSSKPAS
jgi:GNAT superfamily N-acetyltransferase